MGETKGVSPTAIQTLSLRELYSLILALDDRIEIASFNSLVAIRDARQFSQNHIRLLNKQRNIQAKIQTFKTDLKEDKSAIEDRIDSITQRLSGLKLNE